MRYLLTLLIFTLLSPQLIFAQADTTTFNIRIFGGDDITPPTTPVLLSATPVATTQIDLSWSTSTDNLVVDGYNVFRDGTPIATTTQLTYSDTGLIASTTYSYLVRAFDVALNYSTSSNSISTTTLDNPSTSTISVASSTGSSEGTASRVVLENFVIREGLSTTSISLTSAHPARFEIRWGRTGSYELGYIVNSSYIKNHEFLLTDLEPGTTYEYQIIGFTPRGQESIVESGSFTTISKWQHVLPSNVARFTAVRNAYDVNLSWIIPSDINISFVRIVRSHLGFPQHPHDGAIVYQGKKEKFVDTNILAQYSPVYYTAFVYDTVGNISSGAIALVYAAENIQNDDKQQTPSIGNVLAPFEQATSTIYRERMVVDMKMPEAFDIYFIQDEKIYSLVDKDILLDYQSSFIVSIPHNAVAGNLKSIIATFLDPTNNQNTQSFLLRINKDQTAYEATVPALNVLGKSFVIVDIYDYEAFVVATYQAPLSFVEIINSDSESVLFPDVLFKSITPPILAGVFAFLFFSIILLVKYIRRGEDKK